MEETKARSQAAEAFRARGVEARPADILARCKGPGDTEVWFCSSDRRDHAIAIPGHTLWSYEGRIVRAQLPSPNEIVMEIERYGVHSIDLASLPDWTTEAAVFRGHPEAQTLLTICESILWIGLNHWRANPPYSLRGDERYQEIGAFSLAAREWVEMIRAADPTIGLGFTRHREHVCIDGGARTRAWYGMNAEPIDKPHNDDPYAWLSGWTYWTRPATPTEDPAENDEEIPF